MIDQVIIGLALFLGLIGGISIVIILALVLKIWKSFKRQEERLTEMEHRFDKVAIKILEEASK